jgi:hypothetical protein
MPPLYKEAVKNAVEIAYNAGPGNNRGSPQPGNLDGAVRMRRAFVWIVAACATLAPPLAAAAEITELPEGPNRDLVSKTCQSCHDLQMVFDAVGFSREEWDMTLEEMNANGMNVSTDDRAKILEDLATYLGPSPDKAKTPN